MSNERQGPRKPATKFPQLQKKIQKQKISGFNNKSMGKSAGPRGKKP